MIRGADARTVRNAIDRGDPLPGTDGFAGRIDGTLVRDVLGREPVFSEVNAADPVVPDAWSFDPRRLDDPVALTAGCARTRSGERRIWSLPDFDFTTEFDEAVANVREAVLRSVDDVRNESLAVAFSGGIDSAVLAARLDAPLYVTGFPGSHDLAAAQSAAALLDADLTVVELTRDDLVTAVPDVALATRRTNAMDVGIALPLYLTALRVAGDGFERLAVGQGADELFGGYAKVARAPDDSRVDANTVAGARREVVRGLPDQLERDVLAVRAAGVEPVAPLLHGRVVESALCLPGELLVGDRGERKWAFRLAAREVLPDPIAFREKKALQYGSLVARELDRLARRAGFKRRMDDHVTRYVESLVDGGT